MKRFKRGFRTNSTAQQLLGPLFKTNLLRSATMALLYNSSIWGAGAVALAGIVALPGVIAPFAVIPCLVAAARQQRAIENMVHDASHDGWSRKHRRLADLLANLACAWPTGMSVEAYRRQHDQHHARFGTDRDPCRQRVPMLRGVRSLGGFLRALPRYTACYYADMGGAPVGVLITGAWHATMIAGLAATIGLETALQVWGLAWFLPAILLLPAIRLLAEAAEHDYDRGPPDDPTAPTEFSTTFDNVSWLHRWVFRPWNDHAHLAHHMMPNMPQSQLGKAHRILVRTDADYARSTQHTRLFN